MLNYTCPHRQGAAASEASDGGSRRLSAAQMAQGHRPERRRPCHQPFFTQGPPRPSAGALLTRAFWEAAVKGHVSDSFISEAPKGLTGLDCPLKILFCQECFHF